jgi:hypothetical protein
MSAPTATTERENHGGAHRGAAARRVAGAPAEAARGGANSACAHPKWHAMNGHPLILLAGILVGVVGTLVASLATRYQLMPEVVDLSIVLTGAGLGGLLGAACGALRRWPPERLGRVVLLGNLVGGGTAAVYLLAGVSGILATP